MSERESFSLINVFANVFEWITFFLFSFLMLLFSSFSRIRVYVMNRVPPYKMCTLERSMSFSARENFSRCLYRYWLEYRRPIRVFNLDFRRRKKKNYHAKKWREFFDESAVGWMKREKIGNSRMKFGKFPIDSWFEAWRFEFFDTLKWGEESQMVFNDVAYVVHAEIEHQTKALCSVEWDKKWLIFPGENFSFRVQRPLI